jgi:2-C-methyl-D-erythritol 2,4-cyclodiphosphate synthase
MYRVGIGFDAHQFSKDRKLLLGGVEISGSQGLRGHSDADALLHALGDALLGAAAWGDIGTHFPDTDPAWKGVSSAVFIEKILAMLKKDHWNIVNADLTIIAQVPKLQGYKSAIKKSIALMLHLSEDCINIKATTTDQMGFVGREEGIAAQAVVLIEKLS